MSSETKSRAGRTAEQVVNEWRESGSQDWGQLVSAINYWAVTDMCPALVAPSGADTGGREFEEILEWAHNSIASCDEVLKELGPAHKLIDIISAQREIYAEIDERMTMALVERAAGTTGAEGLREALERMLSPEFDWEDGEIGVGHKFRAEARTALAATQRAPVTPPAPNVEYVGPDGRSHFRVTGGNCHCGHTIINDFEWRLHIRRSKAELIPTCECLTFWATHHPECPTLATPAPVTTPGRDAKALIEELEAVDRKLSQHPYCFEAARYIRERKAELLAAAKEPRG